MSLPSYIAKNIDERFENSSEEIQNIIATEVDHATLALAEKYKVPLASQPALSNVITFTLLGAIEPDNVVQALQDLVNVSGEDAIHLATDLEHSVFEKARISLFKKSGDVKTLEFQGDTSKENLRKELLDTTKRESGITKSQGTPLPPKKTTVIAPGSRAQLLEQLQVLSSIPNDEEIESRLKHIQEQIALIKKQEEENTLDSKIALKSFMFGEKGKSIAEPSITPATYSVAPTKYNVDPYRELSED